MNLTISPYAVRQFVGFSAKEANIEMQWKVEGCEERGYDVKVGKCIIVIVPKLFSVSGSGGSHWWPKKGKRETRMGA